MLLLNCHFCRKYCSNTQNIYLHIYSYLFIYHIHFANRLIWNHMLNRICIRNNHVIAFRILFQIHKYATLQKLAKLTKYVYIYKWVVNQLLLSLNFTRMACQSLAIMGLNPFCRSILFFVMFIFTRSLIEILWSNLTLEQNSSWI